MGTTPGAATERVLEAYARIDEVDRPEVWILLRPRQDALADAALIDARVAAGEDLPLAGLVAAVKDNIDVAGLPTTAGCPAFSYQPREHSASVGRLTAAGAVVLGKTNLDQFATGLVGTRSPYGPVRDAHRPDHISGGSSSGSAVAVALGLADIGLGTDTAGSGRVPAALQGIVGLKPTRGLVSTRGVVPACRGLDCVSVFARDLATATLAGHALVAPDDLDAYSRTWPADAPLAAPTRPRVGVARPADLEALSGPYLDAYETAVRKLELSGAVVVPVDLAPFSAASALLYGGSFVAARYTAVGVFLEEHAAEVDPVVAAVIRAASSVPAFQLAADQERLADFARDVATVFKDVDALMLPTTTRHPLLREVQAEPLTLNAELGVYTNFCNLLDLCAVAVPSGEAAGGPYGVTVFAPAFADCVAADIAARMTGADPTGVAPTPAGVPLAVFGAHLLGQPLNHQLIGARLVGEITTRPCYELFALDTEPPKPGLLRVEGAGGSIGGELWLVPPTTLAAVLASLPAPMTLGRVKLDDDTEAVGFLCESAAVADAQKITSYGSWTAFLRATD